MYDMSEWYLLGPGVYLHRWRPQLLLVRSAICAELNVPDDMTDEEWRVVARLLWGQARDIYRAVRDARVEVEDVLLVESLPDVPQHVHTHPARDDRRSRG